MWGGGAGRRGGRGGNVGRGRRGRAMCGTGAGRRGEGTRVLDGVMCVGNVGDGWSGRRIVRRGKGGKDDPAPACVRSHAIFFRICESLGPSVSVFRAFGHITPDGFFASIPKDSHIRKKIALQARKTSGMHAPWPALQTRERTGRPELRGGRSRGYGIVWKESKSAPEGASIMNGGDAQIRTGGEGFAGLCLTTWPRRQTLSSRKRAGQTSSV